MDKISLKPFRSDAIYHGRFGDLAFDLLANPVPVYQSLLKHIGKYGAALKDLKFDASVLSEANISCYLLDLSTMILVRLDRLEVDFFKLHEIGEQFAKNIVLDSWAAIHEADASIDVAEHVVLINSHTLIGGDTFYNVVRRYVTVPTGLAEKKTRAGLVLYSADDPSKGQRGGSVVLDRLVGQEQGLLLKVNVSFDAKQVSFDALHQRIDEYLTEQLDQLGLRLDRGNAR